VGTRWSAILGIISAYFYAKTQADEVAKEIEEII
jgi:hypothetical protein